MFIPAFWIIFIIAILIGMFFFLLKELKKVSYILKARDEWLLLLIERETDPKGFCDKYKKEPLDRNEYFYLHKYYTENKGEDVVADASPGNVDSFPNFWFEPKIFD